MPSVGKRLKEARETQGLDLAELAARTRIQKRYLEAIEQGDVSALPGGFFKRSFVRQYARELGIPLNEIENDLERWLAVSAPESPKLVSRISPTGLAPVTHVLEGRRRPRRKLLGAVLALVAVIAGCAALYSLWLEKQTREAVAIVPDEPVAVRESAPPPAVTEAPSQEEPDTSAVAEASKQTPPDRAAVPRSPAGPLWFEIQATEEVWVRVKSADKTLFVGILESGESRRFAGLTLATLRVGNAGGLSLQVNGKPYGTVGPRGRIRDVILTPVRTVVRIPQRPAPLQSDGTTVN